MSRYKDLYKDQIVDAMIKKFEYKNEIYDASPQLTSYFLHVFQYRNLKLKFVSCCLISFSSIFFLEGKDISILNAKINYSPKVLRNQPSSDN